MAGTDRSRRRAQAALPLVLGVAALGMLTLVLSRFTAREEERPPPRSTYLDDEQGVIARRRAAQAAAEAEAAARVRAAREATRRRIGARENRSQAAFSRLFRSASPAPEPGGYRSDAAEAIADADVLYRVLGTEDGDFLYHRTRGWLRYQDGAWVPVRPEDFPPALAEAYPRLAPGPGGISPEGAEAGGDGVFEAPGWLAPEEEP